MLDAIILAGGLGTRLAPRVSNVPKPIAPIRNTPFLLLLLEQLKRSNLVSSIVLALGHRAQEIVPIVPSSIYTSIEPEPMGTGGALLLAASKTTAKTLLVLNGDSFFDLSFSSFLAFHHRRHAKLSIAARTSRQTSRYGLLQLDPFLRIRAFEEKKICVQGIVSAGIYLIERDLLARPPTPCSLEADLFPAFLKKRSYAYVHTGAFIDIGTPDSYEEAQTLLKPWIPT